MYVLKSGESLQQVAANKNMPFRTLLDANPDLSAHNEWPAGTKVRIPTIVLRTSNERVVAESHEHPFHSYYEEQKRWLERLHRSRLMQLPCFPEFSQPYRDVPQRFGRDEQRLGREADEGDGERDERDEHDELEERREQHQKRHVKSGPKPKKRIKRKKRKHTHHREHRHSHRESHHMGDEESHESDCTSEEPQLPWLNV
jgi:hypothetical protein